MAGFLDNRTPSPAADLAATITAFGRRFSGALVVLGAVLICAPFINALICLGDEGIWLHAADRMLDGQILYRDFFELHPPLGFLIIYGWLGVFGPSLLAARILVTIVVAMTAWFAYACCRTMTGRTGLSTLLALTWVAASQGGWTQVNHHWFTTLFSMICLWALMVPRDQTRWPFLAGCAAGAATLITTHRGGLTVLAGLAALLPRRSVKALASYCLGGVVLLVILLGFLWWQGTWREAFEQVVLYPLRHYSNIQGITFGAFSTPQQYVAIATFPAIAILLILGLRRYGLALLRRPGWSAACAFAVAGFAGCFPRPDAVHIAFTVVMALPLLAGLIDLFVPMGREVNGLKAFMVASVLLTALPLILWAQYLGSTRPLDSAAGQILIADENGTREMLHRLAQLPAADTVFFYPYIPMLPFLSGRRHPARLDILVPEYSTPEQYADTCHEVMKGAQWVVYDAKNSTAEFYRKYFPAMSNPLPPEKLAFERALEKGFVEDAHYGDLRLLRRAQADARLCAGLTG